jgi:hypothetical protein
MIRQEVVRSLCASHRDWHCWCAKTFLEHRGFNLDVFLGTTDDAEGGTSRAPFMEEEVRR